MTINSTGLPPAWPAWESGTFQVIDVSGYYWNTSYFTAIYQLRVYTDADGGVVMLEETSDATRPPLVESFHETWEDAIAEAQRIRKVFPQILVEQAL